MLVDTHCHLDFDDFAADRNDILGRARQVGVNQIITIGIDLATSQRAIDLAADLTNSGTRGDIKTAEADLCIKPLLESKRLILLEVLERR